LVGPKLTNRQFARAIATASIAMTQMVNTDSGAFSGTWDIIDVDADWDDESEQDELKIEAQGSCSGSNPSASINGFTFHVTILAALPRCLKFKFRHTKRGSHRRHRPYLWSEMRASKDF